MKERIDRKITCLSLALAIGVVFIHTFNLEVYGISQSNRGFEGMLWHAETYTDTILRVCVPFFFFISGYLFYRNYDWSKVWTKYRSRVVSLLLPYILWCTLYFFAYYIITHIPALEAHMNMEPVSMTFFYYINCLWNSTYTVLWFVKYLIFSIISAPLFFLFFSKKATKMRNIVSCIISLLIIGYAMLCNENILHFVLPLPFMNVYFLVGGWVSIHLRDFMEKKDKRKIVVGIIILAVCLVCVFGFSSLSITYYNTIWTIGAIFSIWFTIDVFSYDKPVSRRLGGQSFFIYCAHSLLLEALEKIWLLVAGRTPVAAAVDFFLMPFVVVFVLFGVSAFLNIYCNPIYSVLIGGRDKRLHKVIDKRENGD